MHTISDLKDHILENLKIHKFRCAFLWSMLALYTTTSFQHSLQAVYINCTLYIYCSLNGLLLHFRLSGFEDWPYQKQPFVFPSLLLASVHSHQYCGFEYAVQNAGGIRIFLFLFAYVIICDVFSLKNYYFFFVCFYYYDYSYFLLFWLSLLFV